MRPDLSHEIELSPPFHDIDLMEVVWHGHYVKYLELARCALLAKFDYDYPQMLASGFAWPVVDMRLKYVQPALYGKTLKIRAEITEWENRLRIDYVIRDASTGRKVNQAHTVQVAVSMATKELQYICPPVLWQRLGVKPE
ncbi:acyl-CoA thioesterase [Myxococcus sp. CA051A]|uniref:Acyl-CoA thioesterase n=1 Tax=Myxococcus llanfairpwllgwyngyllgogerychwyrndrobwllllantysiliogogogochensis TaxID=2590453 RepID=A0A540X8G0_9BACT|nr:MULTISPECIES: acyl-CoA thioesterase [Myxococcus]NTX03821.1 acyl-CoA thioesterase [Myxococcus sp. CA040A]NTX14018.1 acyl-CoA thioesterase [Myxococcus sp. CA056]NTX35595.1 acyl-CoA thioesterase [Myxococcus sp. CA033]NTX50791.1 acyl-CoA thioesterase [Myxococcus sp. CA039A]NTX62000.1 acyl-CoA thioesterase [Myxococcus sp. CA051A]